ncbi:MAG: glycoside hydrolase family 27 protein, partial [Actinomycetota bacterium]|nr:glycoside hydrolase family 27 protein [Actinomycetota bacterium]
MFRNPRQRSDSRTMARLALCGVAAITVALGAGVAPVQAATTAQAATPATSQPDTVNPAGPVAHPAVSSKAPAVQPNTIRPWQGLAKTPPMGWNDWSYYQCNISEQLILDQGRALVSSGLAAKGYNTVTTDDCWMQKTRDAAGNLQTNTTLFPDGMAYVGAQLHKMGLKFGIYEDAGTSTCGGYAGSYDHWTADANLFASWGVDYLKLDGCNVPVPAGQSADVAYRAAYKAMSDALVASGRKIVYSESAPAYFQGEPDWYDVISWCAQYGNLWREGADIALGQESSSALWNSINYNYSYNVPLNAYGGPGHWNDPDFLLVGDKISDTEAQSQLTLWAEMAAPLISSTDLTKLTATQLSILGNKDIIAVDQDKLGVQGNIVETAGSYDILNKPLANGDRSVVFYNKGETAQTLSIGARTLGLTGSRFQLKDLVSKTVTVSGGTISANV